MSNYTINNLKDDIKTSNYYQADSGSVFWFEQHPRYDRQNIDLYKVMPDGRISCESHIQGGSSRECVNAMYRAERTYRGYTFPQTKSQLTWAQALQMCKVGGVDFSLDFHQLSNFNVGLLVTWAKLTRYRKPRATNGSLARYFYNHLINKVGVAA